MKIRQISHWDLDGCVAIINVLNVCKKHDYQWLASGYGKIDKQIDKIDRDFDILFITDLNYTEEQLRKVGALKTATNKIIYIDHHSYDYDLPALCDELDIICRHDEEKCGSLLTFEYLSETFDIAEMYELSRITDIYDLWKKDDVEFFTLAHPLNDLFWHFSMDGFIKKFKEGYILDDECVEIISKKRTERKAHLEDSYNNHSVIDEENKTLIIMNPNRSFTNDFTLFYPDYNVYLMLGDFKDAQFIFSMRINTNNDLTIKLICDTMSERVKNPFIYGGHEKAGGITVEEIDIDDFMKVFEEVVEEL